MKMTKGGRGRLARGMMVNFHGDCLHVVSSAKLTLTTVTLTLRHNQKKCQLRRGCFLVNGCLLEEFSKCGADAAVDDLLAVEPLREI